MWSLDLLNPSISYMIGFIYADGSLSEYSRNRGRLTIEINSKDASILKEFQTLIPFNSTLSSRTRSTQFKNNHEITTWAVFVKEFRDELIDIGLNYGKKSDIIKPPNRPYSELDFIRGFIDGDGSLGISNGGYPFVSVVISSEEFKEYYCEFLFRTLGIKKAVNRNKRDNVYNIILYREDAQKLVDLLYYDDCLCLERKKEKAAEVLSWVRPNSIKKRIGEVKKWDDEQDQYILTHTLEESMSFLNRTRKSINIRLWRLNKQPNEQ